MWLGFPSSNVPHGSPEYYSAGYPFHTVAKLLPPEFEILISGHLGSKRNYIWTHCLREWPSLDELNNPIRFIWRSPISLPRKIVRTLRRLRQLSVVFSNTKFLMKLIGPLRAINWQKTMAVSQACLEP